MDEEPKIGRREEKDTFLEIIEKSFQIPEILETVKAATDEIEAAQKIIPILRENFPDLVALEEKSPGAINMVASSVAIKLFLMLGTAEGQIDFQERVDEVTRYKNKERMWEGVEFSSMEILYWIGEAEELNKEELRNLEVAEEGRDKNGKVISLKIIFKNDKKQRNFNYFFFYPALNIQTHEMFPLFPEIWRLPEGVDISSQEEANLDWEQGVGDRRIAQFREGKWHTKNI